MRNWNAQQIAGIFRGERPPRLVNPRACVTPGRLISY